MKQYLFSALFVLLFLNSTSAQFPYPRESYLSEYGERPDFLADLGLFPLKKYHYVEGRLTDEQYWDYFTFVRKDVKKIIRYQYPKNGERRNPDGSFNYKNIITYNKKGYPLLDEERNKQNELEWKKKYYYKKGLVKKIVMTFPKEIDERYTIEYSYDFKNRVLEEVTKNKDSKIIETFSLEYLGDTVIQIYNDYRKRYLDDRHRLKWRKKYIYKEKKLKEVLSLGMNSDKILRHVKFNENGVKYYYMSFSGGKKSIFKFNKDGTRLSGTFFNEEGKIESRSYNNPNSFRYDDYGNLIFQEIWEYGRLSHRDSFLYSYDSLGNIIEKQTFFASGRSAFKRMAITNFSFDEYGRKIRDDLYAEQRDFRSFNLYFYSDKGLLLKKEEYFDQIYKDKLCRYTEFEYSKKGEFIKKSYYVKRKDKWEIDYEEGIKFNERGQQIETYNRYPRHDENMNLIYDFKRQYDSNGRLIMHTRILPDGLAGSKKLIKWEIFYK